MKISKFTGGTVHTNAYLVESTGGNFLIDAPQGVAEWLKTTGVRLDGVLLTHQHYDHVEDVAALRRSGQKIFAYSPYSKDLTLESYGSSWGLPEVESYEIDEKIPEGNWEIAGITLRIGYVPGHSKDSITIYEPGAGVVFAGDTLFSGAVGRCDLPGGNFEMLLAGIRRELLILPDETQVFPGHGYATTIGREKISNGYLR